MRSFISCEMRSYQTKIPVTEDVTWPKTTREHQEPSERTSKSYPTIDWEASPKSEESSSGHLYHREGVGPIFCAQQPHVSPIPWKLSAFPLVWFPWETENLGPKQQLNGMTEMHLWTLTESSRLCLFFTGISLAVPVLISLLPGDGNIPCCTTLAVNTSI